MFLVSVKLPTSTSTCIYWMFTIWQIVPPNNIHSYLNSQNLCIYTNKLKEWRIYLSALYKTWKNQNNGYTLQACIFFIFVNSPLMWPQFGGHLHIHHVLELLWFEATENIPSFVNVVSHLNIYSLLARVYHCVDKDFSFHSLFTLAKAISPHQCSGEL